MPRNKYPEITVEKILNTAKKLFLEKGYEQTTIQDIVDELGGLTKGAIYHHFKSKEEIMCALESSIFFDNTPFRIAEEQENKNGLQKLQMAVRLNQDNQKDNEITKQFVPLLKNPRILASMLESNRKYLSPCFLKLLEEGKKDDSINTEYAKEIAELIPLLEVWMLPSVYPATQEEMVHKLLFIKELFEKMGVPLFDEEVMKDMQKLCADLEK